MIDQQRCAAALARAAAAACIGQYVAMACDAAGGLVEQAVGAPRDAVFRVASMTKAVVSIAAMQLVEQGRLSLDAPIAALLPALAAPRVLDGFNADGAPVLRPARTAITLRHLLAHTAGYGYDTWNPELGRVQAALGLRRIPEDWDAVARTVLLFEPGTRWNYGISTDLVGKAVEAASGLPLDDYLRAHVCGPLGMADTVFVLDGAQRGRLAPMFARQADGGLAPIERAAGLETAFCMGGGRVLSTGPDYLRLLRMMLGGGALDGVRVLRAQSVAEMGRNQIGDLVVQTLRSAVPELSCDADLFPGMVQKWGLGFLINTAAGPAGRSAGSLAWAGLNNTYFWIDPAQGVAGLLMTQIAPFADAGALALFAAFEASVYSGRGASLD